MRTAEPPQEGARIKSLRALNILNDSHDPQLDILVTLTARQLGVPYAAVNLIDAEVQWTKASYGLSTGPLVGRNGSLCALTILHPDDPTIVADTRLDRRFADLPVVREEPGVRAYAGVPLKDCSGLALGTLCVFDDRPRNFDAFAINALKLFAQLVESRLEHHRVEEVLRESEDHHRHLVELSPALSWIASATGDVEEVSERWLAVMGIANDDRARLVWADAVYPGDRATTLPLWERSLATGEPCEAEYRLRVADGSYRWFRSFARARRNQAGDIIRWYGADEDIHDRKMAELALQESEHRLRFALDTGRLGTWELDLATGRATLSETSARGLGLLGIVQEVDQAAWLSLIHPDDQLRVRDTLGDMARSGETGELEFRTVWQDGSLHWVRSTGRGVYDAGGLPVKVRGLTLDITDQRRVEEDRSEAEARLHHLAYHDSLTGLANRRLFHETINDAVTFKEDNRLALLFIDLDDFKRVNDTLGHEAGDILLVEAGRRIQATTRKRDLVARLGGDEFAVLQTDTVTEADVEALARRILEALAEPCFIGAEPVLIGGSIGVSLALDHATRAERLMRDADAALYEAKAAGKGFYRLHKDGGRPPDHRLH